MVLFGPSFAAASCTFLRFREKHEYLAPLEPLNDLAHHPSYACRHKLLVQAIRLLGWDKPITKPKDGAVHNAEMSMLNCILEDKYDPWAALLTKHQVQVAIDSIKGGVLVPHGLNYESPSRGVLKSLVRNLSERVPPVATSVSPLGIPRLNRVGLSQVLHAGWMYWLGRHHFPGEPPTFLDTNRLCHLGLIQNDAVRKAIDEPPLPRKNVRSTRPLRDHLPA